MVNWQYFFCQIYLEQLFLKNNQSYIEDYLGLVKCLECLHAANSSSHRRCSVKKGISQNSKKNTCVRVSFLINLMSQTCNFIKKQTLAQVFSYEFYEICQNTFSIKHIRTTASVLKGFNLSILIGQVNLIRIVITSDRIVNQIVNSDYLNFILNLIWALQFC